MLSGAAALRDRNQGYRYLLVGSALPMLAMFLLVRVSVAACLSVGAIGMAGMMVGTVGMLFAAGCPACKKLYLPIDPTFCPKCGARLRKDR